MTTYFWRKNQKKYERKCLKSVLATSITSAIYYRYNTVLFDDVWFLQKRLLRIEFSPGHAVYLICIFCMVYGFDGCSIRVAHPWTSWQYSCPNSISLSDSKLLRRGSKPLSTFLKFYDIYDIADWKIEKFIIIKVKIRWEW